ncbi:MAG: putative toxin-antitoxin system toxin component, PIN family [Saprospiraceae bacterium]|nr:putative toxin-antitoxin system toxin component, PIN family [Lewinellaceae bacterium]
MKVVLDTNVLLVSLSRRSATNWIFQLLLDGELTLCVTTDILFEYEEIIARHMGQEFSEEALGILLDLENLLKIERYFYWNLLEKDPDDNKFIDCAIAAAADVLVSEDRVFQQMKQVKFPQVTCMRIDEFAAVLGI